MKLKLLLLIGLLTTLKTYSQIEKAPPRAEGDVTTNRLIIRGVTLINSTGAPPLGPVDIVVEKNKIAQISQVGYPGVPIDQKRRPQLKEGDKELDCNGMYLMPGFVDMHGHIGGKSQGTPAEYVFKLWLGHGITTIRDPSAGNGLDWTLDQKRKSDKSEITAPRILAYTAFGMGSDKPITSSEEARKWVQENVQMA
jgi:imidazolonepropionase-like amidohydrolase